MAFSRATRRQRWAARVANDPGGVILDIADELDDNDVEVTARLEAIRRESKDEIESLRAEMRERFQTQNEVTTTMKRQSWAVILLLVGLLTSIIAAMSSIGLRG